MTFLHELLALLQVEQGYQQEEKGAGDKYDAVLDGNDCPGSIAYIPCRSEGIEENVPLALTQRILQHQKKHADDYQHHRGTVAVAYHRGEHEGQHPQEENRHHHLSGHTENIKLHYHHRGEDCEKKQDQEGYQEDEYYPDQPH